MAYTYPQTKTENKTPTSEVENLRQRLYEFNEYFKNLMGKNPQDNPYEFRDWKKGIIQKDFSELGKIALKVTEIKKSEEGRILGKLKYLKQRFNKIDSYDFYDVIDFGTELYKFHNFLLKILD